MFMVRIVCLMIIAMMLAFSCASTGTQSPASPEKKADSPAQPKTEDFVSLLPQVAVEVNKGCPKMVDEETRIDSVEVVDGNKFQYNYTMINLVLEETDAAKFNELIRPIVLENTMNMKAQNNPFILNKITMVHVYKDKNGAVIARLEITPNDYM